MNADERRSEDAERSLWARFVAMKNELLEMFLVEDCDAHVRSALLAAIDKRPEAFERQAFSFNRFNVVLDFVSQQAVIDDELNPDDAEHKVPLDEFRQRVAGNSRVL